MVTVNELIVELQKIVALNPKFGEFPCIYSHDDEGNEYQGVMNTPTLVEAQNEDGKPFDLKKNYRFLEIQEICGDYILETNKKYNCVIIN